jgi:DNA-binding response OmpR family regulator
MTRVLLADDDPFMRRVSEVALKRAGFVVRSVGDGTEALQLLEDTPVDVVLLDGQMPAMDGLDACRRMKANPRTAHIPVIMLTARTDEADRDEGLAAGAAGYITKPFDPLTLGARVREIFEHKPSGSAESHDAR